MQTSGTITGQLYGRTWRIHGAVAEGLGEHVTAYLEWSYDGDTEVRKARRFASGENGRVWDLASRIPAVQSQIAEAKAAWGGADRARREAEERLRAGVALRAEAERDGQPCHIRFGALPPGGRSTNHRDGTPEPGVSVYAAWQLPGGRYVVDLRGLDVISAAFIVDDDAPVYQVTGLVLDATGADGEPLIRDARARRVHPTSIVTVI